MASLYVAEPKRPKYAALDPIVFVDDFGDEFEYVDYPAIAADWAKKVLTGEYPGCRYVKYAAKRYLRMLDMAETGKFGFVFSEAHAVDVCAFAELLPLFEDNFRDIEFTELEPWQIFILCALYGFRDIKYGYRFISECYVEVPRKNAKDLALDTPIPTPAGWSTMGELEIGDEVFAADGSVAKVISTSPVFTKNKCYRLTFSNGESVVAGEGHLWLTTARVDKVGAGVGQGLEKAKKGESLTTRVRTTQEIFETQRHGKRADVNHSVSMPDALDLPDADLPLDPYLVGAWLGDGTSRYATITCGDEDVDDISESLSACGAIVSAHRNKGSWTLTLRPAAALGVEGKRLPTLKGALGGLGLLQNKHIPAAYLRASRAQRIALLQGLMDTDGTIDVRGRQLSFCTTKEALRDGVGELLASLGIKYSCIGADSFISGRKVKNQHWKLTFVVFADEVPAFRLARKLVRQRLRSDLSIAPRSRSVQIVSVEEVETVATKCIAIDHPSKLFLFGRTMLPTHNSVLATVIGLYDVRNERSRNPLVLIAASTIAQAGRVFNPMRGIIDGSDGMTPTLRQATKEFREAYRLEATDDIIRCGRTGGTIEKVASIGKRQDGWNPTTVILEELHAQNPDVYAVLKSAIGSRGGQLLFQITTAGRDSFGLAWDNRKAAIARLEGHHEDLETLRNLDIIFTLDREDLLDDLGNKKTEHLYQISAEQLWLKACPNLGVSFAMPAFHMLAAGARSKPQEREEFLRTRLNIWTNSASAIIDIEAFRRGVRDFKLEQFRGQRCWIGVDLSASEDLSAVAICFEMPSGELVTFCKFYMSGDSSLLKDDDYVAMVRAWVDSGLISSTREGAVDFRLIEADIRDLCAWFDVQAIGFDPAMAGQMMQNLEDDRLPVVKYVNRPHMMTAAVDDIIARAHTESASSYLYADNPVFEWCAANAQGERKKDGTILPFKDSVDSLNKIDGFVAGSMANGLRINPEFSTKIKKPSVYEKRGLLGASDARDGNQ